MLSFSVCRIVKALISDLLVGTIILLRTSESELMPHSGIVRSNMTSAPNGIYSHLYLKNVHFCSSLFSPDGNTGFVMPERECVTGAAGGCQYPRTSSLFPHPGGHHDR